MEMKYVNPNSKIIVANNVPTRDVLVLKNCENWVRKWVLYIILQEDSLIACNMRHFINFTLLNMQVEWTKIFKEEIKYTIRNY